MVINSSSKTNKTWIVLLVLTMALLLSIGSAYAASTRANISPGVTSNTSSSIKANSSSGNLTVESAGPNYYVQGYAKQEISFWPDSVAASLLAYPGQNRATNFSADKGSLYYTSINAQSGATGVWGESVISF